MPKDLNPSDKTEKPKRQTAVALKDGSDQGELAVITASGRGKIAEQILQLAFDNDIKVREDSALAEMLAEIDLDSPIPSEAFMAVAEILSYVYRANGQPNPFDTLLNGDKEE
jgi:flagellar biosynthesis protein